MLLEPVRYPRMIIMIRYVLTILLALPIFTIHAGAREQLAAFTRNLSALEGQFNQQVLDETGHLREESSGRVALSVPRLLRWEYLVPYPQLILADGSDVWVYDPDLEQASRRPQGSSAQDSPLLVLTDPARLEREYQIEQTKPQSGLDWLILSPKNNPDEAGFQRAWLGFDASGLVRMDIEDALGQHTRITFSGWTRNPTFAADTFRFIPPEGVDVIGHD